MKKTLEKTKKRLPAVRKSKALNVRRGGKALAIKKRKRHPNRPLTEAQIRPLLNAIDDIRDDALIRLELSVACACPRWSASARAMSTSSAG